MIASTSRNAKDSFAPSRPDAARIVAETNWHHTQQVRRHANGSATLRFSVDGLDEILWWLLAWSGFVTVVRPDKLRELFVEQLRAGLEQNERPGHVSEITKQ